MASPGGPRYDSALTPEQRKQLENGIWLCGTCSQLVDKDHLRYTSTIFREWKEIAENDTLKKLSGEIKRDDLKLPYLEVDLIPTSRGRSNRGISNKNPITYVDGRPTMTFGPGDKPIIYWSIFR